jgi:hypothetical protein
MCVLNVQPAYAGSFSVASVQRSPPNASCEEQLKRAAHNMLTAELRLGDRLALEAAMTGANTRGCRLSSVWLQT